MTDEGAPTLSAEGLHTPWAPRSLNAMGAHGRVTYDDTSRWDSPLQGCGTPGKGHSGRKPDYRRGLNLSFLL